jgi:hypothetical protein
MYFIIFILSKDDDDDDGCQKTEIGVFTRIIIKFLN